MPRTESGGFAWTQSLLSNTAAGLVLPVLIIWLSPRWTWPELWHMTVFSLVYAHSVGFTATFAFFAAGPRLERPRRIWATWALSVALLIACGIVGTGIGTAGILLMPFAPRMRFWQLYWQAFQFCLPLCILVGTATGLLESVRSRLRTTSLQLRTQELERERAQKLAAETRLSSLESRVHPHFLFNALNSISALIRENPPAAERLVERLAALLRFSLDAHSGPVTVAQELRVVSDYLEIEQARFGDRLQYSITAPEEVHGCEIPAMSIQTLVENSVKYAIATRREGGRVEITASIENGLLAITVRDDGSGIPPGAIVQGHGLDLVLSRLRVLHGEEAWLDIDGSAVSVRLPARSGTPA